MEEASSVNGGGERISRREIQEAIAKSVELRALHAALMKGNWNTNSPSNLKFLSACPPLLSRPSSQFSAHDYPVFTPSYEDEPLPLSGHIRIASQSMLENWDDIRRRRETQTEVLLHEDASSRKGPPDEHICHADDNKSVTSSSTNYVAFLQTSPGTETLKSKRRTSLEDVKSVSSCNKCKPATISTEQSNSGVPLPDFYSGNNASQNKSRGMILSWLFPWSKRRQKNEGGCSPVRAGSEEVSQVLGGLGIVSIETLKKELIEANQKTDAALTEVSEMKSSFGELKRKLEYLESHCEELKKALLSLSKREKLVGGGGNPGDSLMPVSEVMVDGFLQVVAEARLSMKQFCKTLFRQIDEKDEQLTKNLNLLLKPYKLSFNSKHPKVVFYHLAAIINQAFYQDFENCVFQKNGTPESLDPQQERRQQFQSFVALRNLSWNEVLKKGTEYYSEEFSKFCDQKMNCIIMTLNWTRAWPEPLLHSFFVAAKCVWLLHLLAFSFNPPLMILRVEENRQFDAHYMEDAFKDKQMAEGPSRVKVMVMPGFYVKDRILRCKVLCRYKSAA